jgi:hypothetical protein
MGALGEFLEVVYGPADRFRTVRAVIRRWQDRNAIDRAVGSGSILGRLKARSAPAGPEPRVWETDLRVWMAGPTRVRVEQTRRRDGVVESALVVVDGDRWWHRDYQGHVEAAEPGKNARGTGPALTDAERHFFPASLREYFVGLALEPLGPVRTAGRECVRVRAVERPNTFVWSHWPGFGADEYEFHADPERGVLLFAAGKFEGEVLETNEVVEVTFDEPLDPGLFAYEPRPGEQVRPADPIVEHMTLAAAVARMPFLVLVPTRVPDPDHAHFEVMYHPPRVDGSRPHLSLMYQCEGRLTVNQGDTPSGLDDWEWEAVERGGRRMEISDPGPGAGTRIVRLEHLGTHVDIWSGLEREQTLDLAASLVPASPPSG